MFSSKEEAQKYILETIEKYSYTTGKNNDGGHFFQPQFDSDELIVYAEYGRGLKGELKRWNLKWKFIIPHKNIKNIDLRKSDTTTNSVEIRFHMKWFRYITKINLNKEHINKRNPYKSKESLTTIILSDKLLNDMNTVDKLIYAFKYCTSQIL